MKWAIVFENGEAFLVKMENESSGLALKSDMDASSYIPCPKEILGRIPERILKTWKKSGSLIPVPEEFDIKLDTAKA